MTATPFRILHPTDFSAGGAAAFAHALWMALCMKARLYLLHVETEKTTVRAGTTSRMSATRSRAGACSRRREPPEAVEQRLGLGVAKVSVASTGLAKGVSICA